MPQELKQARYWLLTIPASDWSPGELPNGVVWVQGQKEIGGSTGYEHWQAVAAFARAVRLACVKKAFGRTCHALATRSAAANDYCLKADTAVPGTAFELGRKPFKR